MKNPSRTSVKRHVEITIKLICFMLAFVWIYTGVNKLYDWGGTQYGMYAQSFPIWLAELLIYILPPLEILVGLMLLVTRTRMIGLLLSLVLMLVFTGYVGWVYFGGRGFVPCTCGGIFNKMSWGTHFWINIILLLMSALGIKLAKSPP
jgi:putative oxidoreductase